MFMDRYVRQQLPDVEVLAAVNELRDQFQIRKRMQTRKEFRSMTIAREPYPGLTTGIDPIAYVLEKYGDEIRSGILGSARLRKIDLKLYEALYDRLGRADPPMTVAGFFEKQQSGVQFGEGKQGALNARRVRALAVILGQPDADTMGFFSSIRSGHILSR